MKINKGTALFSVIAGFVSLWTMVARAKTCTGVFYDKTTTATFSVVSSCSSIFDTCSCNWNAPYYDYPYGNTPGEAIVFCGNVPPSTSWTGFDRVVVSSCSASYFF